MWKAIKQPWHGMRMMRLILGIMLVVQAIQLQQYLFIVAGVVLIVFALANIGCKACAGNNCILSETKKKK